MGKAENTGYQHFLLFPQCFQKALHVSISQDLCGKELTLFHTIVSFDAPKEGAFENILGKGDNAGK